MQAVEMPQAGAWFLFVVLCFHSYVTGDHFQLPGGGSRLLVLFVVPALQQGVIASLYPRQCSVFSRFAFLIIQLSLCGGLLRGIRDECVWRGDVTWSMTTLHDPVRMQTDQQCIRPNLSSASCRISYISGQCPRIMQFCQSIHGACSTLQQHCDVKNGQ